MNQMAVRKLSSRTEQSVDVRAEPARAAPGGRSRAGRVRDPREPARSLRPDGEGIPGARRARARRHRAPASGLDAGAGVSAVRRAARAVARLALAATGASYVIAAKGAPEAIADLCHLRSGRKRDAPRAGRRDGRRGPARARRRRGPDSGAGPLPDEQHDFAFEFVGPGRAWQTRAPDRPRRHRRSATRRASAW